MVLNLQHFLVGTTYRNGHKCVSEVCKLEGHTGYTEHTRSGIVVDEQRMAMADCCRMETTVYEMNYGGEVPRRLAADE